MEFTITGTEELAKTGLEVSQNFPNPFDQTTNIQIEINSQSNLELEVFTLAGKLVYAERIDQAFAGKHQFTINAENLGSGMYFYKVSDGVTDVSRKMIVY